MTTARSNRADMLTWVVMTSVTLVFAGCSQSTGDSPADPLEAPNQRGEAQSLGNDAQSLGNRVVKTDAEWRAELSSKAYDVLRNQGTERAFTGIYWDEKRDGVYRCGGCGQTLFSSAAKFVSGTGWPSYWEPIDDAHVATEVDDGWFAQRTEVHCSRCDGHLGHVFDDGPEPTGLRYCINSAALDFHGEAETELED